MMDYRQFMLLRVYGAFPPLMPANVARELSRLAVLSFGVSKIGEPMPEVTLTVTVGADGNVIRQAAIADNADGRSK